MTQNPGLHLVVRVNLKYIFKGLKKKTLGNFYKLITFSFGDAKSLQNLVDIYPTVGCHLPWNLCSGLQSWPGQWSAQSNTASMRQRQHLHRGLPDSKASSQYTRQSTAVTFPSALIKTTLNAGKVETTTQPTFTVILPVWECHTMTWVNIQMRHRLRFSSIKNIIDC